MELRVLNDEEIINLVTDYHMSGKQNRHILAKSVAEAQFQSDIKGFLELFNMVGLFRIINKRFVEGEPNCAIITDADYQSLKQLVEEEK